MDITLNKVNAKGQIEITFTIGGQTYTQAINNMPTDSIPSLKSALKDYLRGFKSGLQVTKNQPVASDVTQAVTKTVTIEED